jgi:hypothetical protein
MRLVLLALLAAPLFAQGPTSPPVGCSSVSNTATSGQVLSATQTGRKTGTCQWGLGAGAIPANAVAPIFVSAQNAGTDVICALHADTIAGLTCNNAVTDGTTATAFATTVTIPAGTLTAGNSVPVALTFGVFGTVTLPTVAFSIKLGGITVLASGTPLVNATGGVGREFRCSLRALAVASSTTPIVASCVANTLATAANIYNALITNTTKSIAVDTTVSQALSVTVTFSAATSGNAIWLYAISPN